jgi:hypothetical protein
MPLIIEMKDVVKPKLTLRVDGNHSIKLPPSLPAERMQQLIEFAKFITHPQASQIFEHYKMSSIQVFMNNPQQMFQTINDFFNYCYTVALEHFKRKLNVETFRCFDKSGKFLFSY